MFKTVKWNTGAAAERHRLKLKKKKATSHKLQAINETVPYNDIEEAQASNKRAPRNKHNQKV